MNILIVDDHKIVRNSIKLILEEQPSMCVVAQAQSGEEALGILANQLDIDLVLTDNKMPGLDGISFVKTLTVSRPELKIVMLSMTMTNKKLLELLRQECPDSYLKPLIPKNWSIACSMCLKEELIYMRNWQCAIFNKYILIYLPELIRLRSLTAKRRLFL